MEFGCFPTFLYQNLNINQGLLCCLANHRLKVTECTQCKIVPSVSNTPIANMVTISPKQGFSVVAIAKGWPAQFFQEFCSHCTEKLDAELKGRPPVQGQISSKYSKIQLRGVVKVSVFIEEAFAFSLLCRFECR